MGKNVDRMGAEEWERRVWHIVKQIPRGKVCAYGQIAGLLGFPRHARQVGMALKRLPEGSGVPWYRVLNAKGTISFPIDSPPYIRQKSLLEREGVRFKANGAVDLKTFGWDLFA